MFKCNQCTAIHSYEYDHYKHQRLVHPRTYYEDYAEPTDFIMDDTLYLARQLLLDVVRQSKMHPQETLLTSIKRAIEHTINAVHNLHVVNTTSSDDE